MASVSGEPRRSGVLPQARSPLLRLATIAAENEPLHAPPSGRRLRRLTFPQARRRRLVRRFLEEALTRPADYAAPMALWTYLSGNWADVLLLALHHAVIVVVSVALGTMVGLGLGVSTYRTPRARAIVLGVTGTMLTVPSLALYGLLVSAGLGLGWPPVLTALVLYSLLPIARNAIRACCRRPVDHRSAQAGHGALAPAGPHRGPGRPVSWRAPHATGILWASPRWHQRERSILGELIFNFLRPARSPPDDPCPDATAVVAVVGCCGRRELRSRAHRFEGCP